MTDAKRKKAPCSEEERLAALQPAFAEGGSHVESVPADRLYRLAALTAGIFLLVSLL